jgi:hypothetical protein
MTLRGESGGSSRELSAVGFMVVWVADIIASLVTFRLAISGTLWDLGFPVWFIAVTVLVGVWQWIWIAPILAYAPRWDRGGLYDGMRRGGIWFSALAQPEMEKRRSPLVKIPPHSGRGFSRHRGLSSDDCFY